MLALRTAAPLVLLSMILPLAGRCARAQGDVDAMDRPAAMSELRSLSRTIEREHYSDAAKQRAKQFVELTDWRTWRDAAGSHSVVARYVGHDRKADGLSVELQRRDGAQIHVPLARLSDEDRRVVRQAADLLVRLSQDAVSLRDSLRREVAVSRATERLYDEGLGAAGGRTSAGGMGLGYTSRLRAGFLGSYTTSSGIAAALNGWTSVPWSYNGVSPLAFGVYSPGIVAPLYGYSYSYGYSYPLSPYGYGAYGSYGLSPYTVYGSPFHYGGRRLARGYSHGRHGHHHHFDGHSHGGHHHHAGPARPFRSPYTGGNIYGR